MDIHEVDLLNYYEITPRFSYNRQKCLGVGSYGKVYKGWDAQRKCQIAVKHLTASSKKSTQEHEKREIDILNNLKHPNIMEYYGSFHLEQDGLFLFLQYCENGDLTTYLKKHKLTKAEARDLIRQLITGMIQVNEKGYLHRDLKPDNLLLTNKNKLKIADFGTARDAYSIMGTLWKSFRKCTPIYSAPEVYLQDIYDEIQGKYYQNCDVFSTGYILYEMLTGQQLTKSLSTPTELINFLKTNRAKGGFKIDHPALTPPWIALITKMLSFDYKNRPSFKAVFYQLQDIKIQSEQNERLDRPFSQDEKFESSSILQKIKSFLSLKQRKNNYLTVYMRILFVFQQEKSQLIPRVYKLLALFYSLGRYCFLSNKALQFLHNPQQIEVDGMLLQRSREKLLPNDEKTLLEFIQVMAGRVNKGVEQIRNFLLKQVIPEIEAVLRQPEAEFEKRVLKEYQVESEIGGFRKQEYIQNINYVNNFQRCVDNLFKTRAETEILSDSDLKIYLVLLLLSEKHNKEFVSRPSVEQVLRLSRAELLLQISKLKVKVK